MEQQTEKKDRSGVYFVIQKGDWSGRSIYHDRERALEFAQSLAKRGYDCDVVRVVARVEACYAVETRIHD